MNISRNMNFGDGVTGIQKAKMIKDEVKLAKKVDMISTAIALSEMKKKLM
jgi:hypothetical protein